MDILGLIPARGGSKSIPHKNIARLAGRPLLAYTCDAARLSRLLTRVLVSTDDPAIAEVGRQCGVDVPFLRPAELSSDEAPMIDVIRHALAFLEQSQQGRPDAVAVLQPTSPLRRAEHIDAAIDLLIETGADSVVSVTVVPHQFNPVSLLELKDGKLVPLQSGAPVLRRQDKPLLYARNGPAVLVTRTHVLLRENRLYGADCRPLVMRPEESLDLDEPQDLERAEALLARRQMKAGKS